MWAYLLMNLYLTIRTPDLRRRLQVDKIHEVTGYLPLESGTLFCLLFGLAGLYLVVLTL